MYKPFLKHRTLSSGILGALFFLMIVMTSAADARPSRILYLDSVRGPGTSVSTGTRHLIASALDAYQGGNIFDVTFIENHSGGDLAALLSAQSAGYYDQIWFDTATTETPFLTSADLQAISTWILANDPEYIIDSVFPERLVPVDGVPTQTALNLTFNEALALRQVGKGLFVARDNSAHTRTANQLLQYLGFGDNFTNDIFPDGLNGQLTDFLTTPNAVNTTALVNPLFNQAVSTTEAPSGTHNLNGNAGNRTVDLITLASAADGTPLISASFTSADFQANIPSPATLILFGLGLIGLGVTVRPKKGKGSPTNP